MGVMLSIRRNKWIILFLTITMLFLFTQTVLAVEDFQSLDKELSKQQGETGQQSSSLLANFIKLILVLGLILAAAWAIINLFGRQVTKKMQGSWLHIADEVMLGQNRGIVLCEIGGRVYALGVTEGQISLLFEVENPDLLEEIKANEEQGPPPEQDRIRQWLDKGRSRYIKVPSSLNREKHDFHGMMQDRLKDFQERSQGITMNNETGAKQNEQRHN